MVLSIARREGEGEEEERLSGVRRIVLVNSQVII